MTKSNAKSKLSAFGNAAATVTAVILDAPTNNRIREIDAEIEKLQKERTELEAKLLRH